MENRLTRWFRSAAVSRVAGRSVAVAAGLMSATLLTAADVSYFEESLPTTMNPLFARAMTDFRTHELVFDRLYYHSAITNELKSRLVERHESLEGGKKIKLYMKAGIKWHDGKPLTAEDVCFTIDAMLDSSTPSTVAKPYREAVAGCEVADKKTAAIIEFTKVYHNPRERVGFSVLPKHMFDGTAVSPDLDFSSRPIGSGPAKGSMGRRSVTFNSFPNAHHNATISSPELRQGGDPYVAVNTLINAGVQGIISVAPSLRAMVASSDDVALKSYDLRSWWFIAVNTSRGALRNQKVRQALNVSLDRQKLRELTLAIDADDPNPPCEFVSGPFVQSSPYYNRSIKVVEKSDKGQAQALLTSAGATQQAGRWIFQGQPISLRIGMHAPLDAEAKDLLSQVGNQLAEGGFDRQVYRVTTDDWNRKAITGELSSEYDMLIGKWSFGLVEDVNALFYTRRGGKGALNIFNYSNREVDAILDRYDAAKTDTEAQDAYHDLHAFLAEDLPYLFLWKLDTKSAWRNEIRGNTIAPYYYFTEFAGWRLDK